jgi:hypothetical protein
LLARIDNYEILKAAFEKALFRSRLVIAARRASAADARSKSGVCLWNRNAYSGAIPENLHRSALIIYVVVDNGAI